MVKIYKQPFAHEGDSIAIPSASQPDGKMSSVDGWTPDYQLPKTDPNYKPVGRQEMNGVFKEVTEALGQVQVQGAASWSADGAPYPINAQVYHDGKQWIALRANSVEPADGEDWTEFSADVINHKIDESALVQTTGASTTDIMSQAAVTDAINNSAIGIGQTWQDVTDSRDLGVTYTNTTSKAITVIQVSEYFNLGDELSVHVNGLLILKVDQGIGAGWLGPVTFIVPSGATYSISKPVSPNIQSWLELRS